MGLLTLILGLPLAPFRGVIKLGELIQDRVNAELTDVSSARHELEAAEEARETGEISADEEIDVQRDVVDRMTEPAPGGDD
ncbi:MAG: gas vesicle protein G [Actinophytocola sp.]|nr:gas vesicle protein G [Actinophytocola sp.]